MQKVVTVTSELMIDSKAGSFSEKTYPELQKILDDGYSIVNTIEVHNERYYAITFVLEKNSVI